MNDYLRGRMSRRMDGRNPYGSRGGYVTSSRRRRDYAMNGTMDYRGSMPEYDSRYDSARYGRRDSNYDSHYERRPEYNRPMEYEMYGVAGVMPRDYRDYRERDYRYDYAMSEEDEEKRYKKDLEEWCEKLKRYDRFGLPKEEIINQARSMGAKFDDYNEMEFIITYYMMISDYPEAFGNYQGYLALAKGFLEDKDAELKGGSKLACYMYSIVKGEEE